ncbi:unnamed protein product [Auanema sp. JU1783]|nr:unnamed protein product [Auanema sp. JU1783]
MNLQAYHLSVSSDDSSQLFAVSKVESRDADQKPQSGKFLGLYKSRSIEAELYAHPTVRRLIVEMHVVFDEARRKRQISGKFNSDNTLSLSRNYRSILRGAADENNPDDTYIRDFTLWSLFETMFLKGGDTAIAYDLILWAHDTFTFVDAHVSTVSEEISVGIDAGHGSFWKAAALCLVALKFDDCIRLLEYLRSDRSACLLMAHLDKFNQEWLLDVSKKTQFETWKKNLLNDLNAKAFEENRNISFLCRSLCGDETVLSRYAGRIVDNWWELMPLYVFAKYATVSYNSLGPIAEECRSFFEDLDDNVEFDPFMAIFHLGDVTILQNMITNPWLSIHLVETMYSSDDYDQPIQELRNCLLLKYGSSLVTFSSLWEIGFSYLLECGAEGKLRIESHILHMNIDDEDKANKLLRICVDNDLEESRNCVINTLTFRHLRAGNWGSALSWALRGGKRKTLDTAVHQIVWNASVVEVSRLGMLGHLNKLVLLSPSLSFLYGYYRFHKALQSGNIELATQVLVPLVLSADVPTSFHKVLFNHLTFILGEIHDRVSISKETIVQLITFFKRYKCSSDMLSEENDLEEQTMTNIQRLLLLRLAKANVLGE